MKHCARFAFGYLCLSTRTLAQPGASKVQKTSQSHGLASTDAHGCKAVGPTPPRASPAGEPVQAATGGPSASIEYNVSPTVPASTITPPLQTGQTYTGDITYYDVSVGLGSCGTSATNTDNVVALSYLDMKNGLNPNVNPLCGREVSISYNGHTHRAKIWDTCPTCASGSLDLPQALFDAVAPEGDGRVHGVSWSLS